MGEKLGKVQALVVEFSADCAAIKAKSRAGGYSEAVDSWGTGVYASYTQSGLPIGWRQLDSGEFCITPAPVLRR